jgi:phosphoglycerol transferase MdoB-like AlkP superfamily enzyme
MSNVILKIPILFLAYIAVFIVGRIFFMIYHHSLYAEFNALEIMNVFVHGLKHDASVAGYLTAIPGLLLLFTIWYKHTYKLIEFYFGAFAFIIATIIVVDIILYEYWGFRLDSTPLFYLATPVAAMASTSWVTNISGTIFTLLFSGVIFLFLKQIFQSNNHTPTEIKKKIGISAIILLQTALLFLPIRGGVKESTMNVGKVFHSNELVLNHAAINPAFSLFESLTAPQQFNKQYRFLPDETANAIFATLQEQPRSESIQSLFNTKRPNIVFVLLESFMSLNMFELGGMPDVAVNLDSIAREGLLFTNMYANSFRTDRALVSILSAFPAQPTTSLMKYPRKLQQLPSLPGVLKKEGYDLQYFYGGDADFTSMRSYLRTCGFERIIEDISFPASFRTTKWGVPDHHVFNKLYEEIETEKTFPFFKVIQTQSSHDPFDVPFTSHHTDPYLNSVVYTDSCMGDFIRRFRKLPSWENSIVVLIPDHAMRYPADLDHRSADRYKIPMVITGGALSLSARIEEYASQIDITATLLYQLGIDHSKFLFSKNILNPASPKFGFFTFKDGFGFVTPDNYYVFDNELGAASTNTGNNDYNKKNAESFIQKLYDQLNEL